jgi:hypothetical protein
MTARHLPARLRARRKDSGSAAAELVLITPLLIVILLFIVAAGRLVDARQQVDSAAMQAARAASLASEHITCNPLAVSPDTTAFRPGGQVTVQVTCTVSLAGLALLHVPGSQTLTAQFTSPIDVYRGAGP